MTSRALHPAIRLLLWCDWVIAAFVLPLPVVMSSLAVTWVALGRNSMHRWLALAWRSRWLMLAILLAISLSVPGEYLIPGYPGTHEGVATAVDQIGRLLVTLAAVAWLLAAPRDELVSAFYTLGAVLGGGRVAAALERFALRVLLVFELVERSRIHWVDLLAPAPSATVDTEMAVIWRPLAVRDRTMIILCLVALLAIFMWAFQ